MFAQIENGKVVNVIVADQAFVDTLSGTYVDISTETPTPGIGWSYDGSAFAAPEVTAPVDPRMMKLVVTSISSDDPNEMVVGTNEITCAAGSTITATVEIRSVADDSVMAVTDKFRLPVSGDNGKIYVLADFTDGAAAITTTIANSGKWVVDEVNVNSNILDESQQFIMDESIIIYTLQ